LTSAIPAPLRALRETSAAPSASSTATRSKQIRLNSRASRCLGMDGAGRSSGVLLDPTFLTPQGSTASHPWPELI